MSIPVREYLQITEESAYGTPATVTRGSNQLAVRLDEGNAFTMEPVPIVVGIGYGGGLAVKKDTISGKMEVKGQLKLKLTYTQAALFLGASLTRISGGTVPWTTTEPNNDLASFTLDHAIWQDDTSAFTYYRYTGCKVAGGRIDVSEQSQVMTLTLDLVGGQYWPNPYNTTYIPVVADNPIPVDTDFATDYITFEHSYGGLYLNSLVTARVPYWNLGIGWQNKLDVNYFAGHFVQKIRCYGRDVNLDAEVMITSALDDRPAFEALTAFPAKVVFTNTTHTLTFTYNAASRISALPRDLPLDRAYRRKYAIENRWDPTASTDFSFTKV